MAYWVLIAVFMCVYSTVAYAQIDWHDFVVVETVDFQQNETGMWKLSFDLRQGLCVGWLSTSKRQAGPGTILNEPSHVRVTRSKVKSWVLESVERTRQGQAPFLMSQVMSGSRDGSEGGGPWKDQAGCRCLMTILNELGHITVTRLKAKVGV